MRLLVCGAGPAGLTAAAALLDQGHAVTLIERSADLQAAGHAINLHGNGLEVARRLGLLAVLQQAALRPDAALYLDRNDRILFRQDCRRLERALDGQLLLLPRAALIDALLARLGGRVDLRLGTRLRALHPQPGGVAADLGGAAPEPFDLVIGADGLYSGLRRLVFPDAPAPRDLGAGLAVWRMAARRPLPAGIVVRLAVGHQATVWQMGGDEISLLLCWRAAPEGWSREGALDQMARVFADMPAIADLVRQGPADRIHLARVAQLDLPRWHHGPVVLIGDAASCGSVLSGQGAALGMAAGWILAEELAQGDPPAAFARYEARMRPASDAMLRIGAAAARSFLPQSRAALWLQARLAPVLMHPALLPLTLRRSLPPRLLV